MNDLPLEILEAVLIRSFLMLYLVGYETYDYVHSTTEDDLPYITAKFRRLEDRPFTLLSSVCWSWYQSLIGWPQSPTPAWLRHQLKKLIKCECCIGLLCVTFCSCFSYILTYIQTGM